MTELPIKTFFVPSSGRRGAWWILLAATVLIAPLLIWVGMGTRRAIYLDLAANARSDLQVHQAYLQSQVEGLAKMTRLVSADTRVADLMARPESVEAVDAANRFLAHFGRMAGTTAFILNLEGRVMASGNWDSDESFMGRDFASRPFFKSAVAGDQERMAVLCTVGNRLDLYFSTPVRIHGRIAAVAMTRTDPQSLLSEKQKDRQPLLITDPYGIVIISHPRSLLLHTLGRLPEEAKVRLARERYHDPQRLRPMDIRSSAAGGLDALVRLRSDVIWADHGGSVEAFTAFVMVSAPMAGTEWQAHLLEPVDGVRVQILKNLVLVLLVWGVAVMAMLFVQARWRYVRQLHQQALRDPLTGLYTRLYMLSSATAMLAGHDRNSIPGVSAVMFDIDRFKRVNDRYGHSAGDNVLVQVAGVLMGQCRSSDMPIRYGGEELLLLLPTGDLDQVTGLARRIGEKVQSLDILLAGERVQITVSGGIAAHLAGESLEKLIDRADAQLYRAKKAGRNRICCQDQSLPLSSGPGTGRADK